MSAPITSQVSPAVRKFAAIGLLIAVLLALFSFVVQPAAQRLAHVEREITAKRELSGRLAALADATEAARALGKRNGVLLSSLAYLPGDSEAIQLANLQSQVLGIAEQEGVRPQSSRALAAAPREGMQVVGLQMALQTGLQTLQRLLHRIEGHRPLLIVDGLAVTPARGAISIGAVPEDTLQVDLRVLALVAPGKGGQP